MKKINQAERARLMQRIKGGDREAVRPLADLYETAGLKAMAEITRLALINEVAWGNLRQQASLMF